VYRELDDTGERRYDGGVLNGLFPEGVVTVWGDPSEPSAPLFPEEEALVARAVSKRKQEFAKGRECARRALATLGREGAILLSGSHREPLWPAETTGSITHTSGLCAVAVALSNRYAGLGIDAEPAEPLEPAVANRVCHATDTGSHRVVSLAKDVLPRIVFSVKEAIYKCQFPLTRKFLGFEDVTTELDEGAFRATLLVDAPPFREGDSFDGRWRLAGSHLVAGTWLFAPIC